MPDSCGSTGDGHGPLASLVRRAAAVGDPRRDRPRAPDGAQRPAVHVPRASQAESEVGARPPRERGPSVPDPPRRRPVPRDHGLRAPARAGTEAHVPGHPIQPPKAGVLVVASDGLYEGPDLVHAPYGDDRPRDVLMVASFCGGRGGDRRGAVRGPAGHVGDGMPADDTPISRRRSCPSVLMRKPPLDGIVVLYLARVLAGPLATMLPRTWGRALSGRRPARRRRLARLEAAGARRRGHVFLPRTGARRLRPWTSGPPRDRSSCGAGRRGRTSWSRFPAGCARDVRHWEGGRAFAPRTVSFAARSRARRDVGPEAGEPGFDLLAQGATGLMSITGAADGPPHKVGVAVVDVLAGWSALAAILGALHARERDGVGSHVKTNLVSTGLAALVNVAGSALVTGRDATRHGNAHATIEPYRMFEAADGPFLLAVGTERQFGVLCERVLGRPDLSADCAVLDERRTPREPERPRPHPRGGLFEGIARDVARALQGRRNPRRSRRGRPRGDTVAAGERAWIDPRGHPERTYGADDSPAVFLRRIL